MAIHNHFSNTPPSLKDISTFDQDRRIIMESIQCHNGNLYGIRKFEAVRYGFTEKILAAMFKIVEEDPEHFGKGYKIRSQIFLDKLITKRVDPLKWEFIKGVDNK